MIGSSAFPLTLHARLLNVFVQFFSTHRKAAVVAVDLSVSDGHCHTFNILIESHAVYVCGLKI